MPFPMRPLDGARGVVARDYPWSTRSSLLALNSDLRQPKTISAAGPCVSFDLLLHHTLESKAIS